MVIRRRAEGELVDAVQLLIIDEVHLLHDQRGAVLESIVARTLRQVEHEAMDDPDPWLVCHLAQFPRCCCLLESQSIHQHVLL